MKKLAEKAEVNPLASTHWLRHSHASHAIEA
jgi:site-specific recombinase XerD